MPPLYSYQALNALSLGDTGHFVYLDAWSIGAVLSMLDYGSALYLWTNDQFPLTTVEIDDLQAKLAEAQNQLMQQFVGLILPVATATIPNGTLLCDGTAYLRVDYPNLYAALDAAFIVDADNFVVPDLQDRFIMGASGTHPIGTPGGADTVTQTVDQMPAHFHTTQPHSHTESAAAGTIVSVGLEPPVPAAVPAIGSTGLTTVTVDNTGGGQPIDILPPFLALRYVVVAL